MEAQKIQDAFKQGLTSKKFYLVMSFFLAVFLLSSVSATSCVGDVANSTGCENNYTSIQSAIDSSPQGGFIVLGAGSFSEALDLGGKSLTIVGNGIDSTIIDSSSFSGYAIQNIGDNTTITDLTLMGSAHYGFKIHDVSNIVLEDIKVQNSGKTGIDLHTIDGAILRNIEVKDTVSGFGLMLLDSKNIEVTDVSTSGNPWGGVSVHSINANAENINFNGEFNAQETVPLLLEKDPPYDGEFVNVEIPDKFGYVVYGFREGSNYEQWFYQETFENAEAFANGLINNPNFDYSNVRAYSLAGEKFYVEAVDGGNGTKTSTISSEINLIGEIINVNIPSGITITSNSGWTGEINAPVILESPSVPVVATEGFTPSIGKVIEVGFPGEKLIFDQAIKLSIPGEAGSLVGYIDSNAGNFVPITTECISESDASNIIGNGECFFSNETTSDLTIWTKHFTEFVTYTETETPTDTSSSGSSGGGGGGGLCMTDWTCSEWSSCTDGIQTRDCTYPENYCEPTDDRPEEVRSCEVSEETEEILEEETVEETQESSQENQGLIATVTGAVVGTDTGKNAGIIIIVMIVTLGVIYFISKRKHIKI